MGRAAFGGPSFGKVLVRLSGFEPPRSCDRQPLKLVRLPIPPQPQWGLLPRNLKYSRSLLSNGQAKSHRRYFFGGAAGGAAGCAGA